MAKNHLRGRDAQTVATLLVAVVGATTEDTIGAVGGDGIDVSMVAAPVLTLVVMVSGKYLVSLSPPGRRSVASGMRDPAGSRVTASVTGTVLSINMSAMLRRRTTNTVKGATGGWIISNSY